MYTIAPKNKQPRGKKNKDGIVISHPGYGNPFHLLAYGPKYVAYNIVRGYFETTEYCIAPSSSIYDKKYLAGYDIV
jgi:hypothetical protein